MTGQFGSYRIDAMLGAGGMGEVYRAHDTRLGRNVALKVLPPNLADDPDRRLLLVREARAAAALNHPNICTIHDVGEAEGRTYLAMELVEGARLSVRVAEGPLPPDEVLLFGIQLADALAHAHDRGVVHRDLKAANVMITPEGRVKVLDFGLAKHIVETGADAATQMQATLAQPGVVLGTVPYMAPEQLRGLPADGRTDIWALGVVLYEMATGARPFDGRTGFEISSAIIHTAPSPMPAHVPGRLQAVIHRCLEKDPARRYQRASEVRAALETVGTAASERVAVVPAAGTRSRRRLAIAIALVVAATIVVFNAAGIRDRLRGSSRPRIRSLAVLPLENRSGNADEEYFVGGVHEALITDLARIGLQKVIAKPSADVFKGTKKSLADIGRELGVDALVTGSVMRAGSRVQVSAQLVKPETGEVLWANRFDRSAGDVISLQNELVGSIAKEVRATLSPSLQTRLAQARPVNPAAHDAYLKGRALFASMANGVFGPDTIGAIVEKYNQAIQLDPTYAPAYAALSDTYKTAAQTSVRPPQETLPKAKAMALKAVELDDELSQAHSALAGVYLWHDWNWPAAEREAQRALELSPESADALIASLEYLVLIARRADDAARTSQHIVAVDPMNPFSRVQTIWTAFFTRRPDEAIRNAHALLELWPTNFMAPFFLNSAYAVTGKRAETKNACDKVMAALQGNYNMQVIGMCTWGLGLVGETQEARRLLAVLEKPPPGIWIDPSIMVNAYGAVGEMDRAIEWCEKGMQERAPNMVYMHAGPPWDVVRSDARFQAIYRQMNFPQ